MNHSYAVRIAILYAMIWFIDLLDASSLNVSLPVISQSLSISVVDANWAIIGFLLSMTIGITLSRYLGLRYTIKPVICLCQFVYVTASIGCGMATAIQHLVLFRVLQGVSAGICIPLGMTLLMRVMPQEKWAKTNASMNMVTLLAPSIGPTFGAYVTKSFGWSFIFFLKLPLLLICLFLSMFWIQTDDDPVKSPFDVSGFIFGSLSLTGILWGFSQVAFMPVLPLCLLLFGSFLLGVKFFKIEKNKALPLIELSLFKNKGFSYGNLIQSAANTIFLGANFLIALYLQKGLGYDLITSGWIMAAITPGMLVIQPIVGAFYNRIGPSAFITVGLLLLFFATAGFVFTTAETVPIVLALLVFFIGAGSSMVQSANITNIFSCISDDKKDSASALYSLFKQISASFGVAFSTMVFSTMLHFSSEQIAFHTCFFFLSLFPALSLCFRKKIIHEKSRVF